MLNKALVSETSRLPGGRRIVSSLMTEGNRPSITQIAIVFVNYVVVPVWLFPDALRRLSNSKIDVEYGADRARVVRVVDKHSVI